MTKLEFSIMASQQDEIQKAFDKMHKHIPETSIRYSEPRKAVVRTLFKGDCEQQGYSEYKSIIVVIDVVIEGIGFEDYELVASVHYRDCAVVMCNPRLFKEIPSQYGLNYDTCDFCGHATTKDAYIVYHNKTHEFKQVGGSCMKKICAPHKYLSAFMVRFYNIVKDYGGWDSEPHGWSVPDYYGVRAIRFDDAIATCIDYRKNVSEEWERSQREYGVTYGTNANLQTYTRRDAEIDTELVAKVIEYAKSLPIDHEDEWNGGGLTLEGKIRAAADAEYIAANEMFIAYFALTGYLKSISAAEFDKKIAERGIVKGDKIRVTGKLVSNELVECEDSYSYYNSYTRIIKVRGTDGFLYVKEMSASASLDKYMKSDTDIEFGAVVKYIARRGGYIGLGGRLSK